MSWAYRKCVTSTGNNEGPAIAAVLKERNYNTVLLAEAEEELADSVPVAEELANSVSVTEEAEGDDGAGTAGVASVSVLCECAGTW